MRKWIVIKDGSYELEANWNRPEGAIIEAPDHFSRDMVPFIEIKEVQDGPHKRLGLHFDEVAYKAGLAKKVTVDLGHADALAKAIRAYEEKKKFNKKNSAQRFLKSVLGEQYERGALILSSLGRKISKPKEGL